MCQYRVHILIIALPSNGFGCERSASHASMSLLHSTNSSAAREASKLMRLSTRSCTSINAKLYFRRKIKPKRQWYFKFRCSRQKTYPLHRSSSSSSRWSGHLRCRASNRDPFCVYLLRWGLCRPSHARELHCPCNQHPWWNWRKSLTDIWPHGLAGGILVREMWLTCGRAWCGTGVGRWTFVSRDVCSIDKRYRMRCSMSISLMKTACSRRINNPC